MAGQTAWDIVADEYHRRHGDEGGYSHREYVLPAMLEMIGPVRGKRILDIGCGPGYLTRPLAKKGAKVTGTDLSSELLKIAQGLEREKPLGIEYLLLDASRLDGIKDSSFDIVTCNLALHAIEDAKSAIRECGRVVKPGGRLVFSIMHPVTDTVESSDYKRDSRGFYVKLRSYGKGRAKAHRGFRLTKVLNYHRPFGFYMNELFGNGFVVSGCRELPIRHVNQVVGLPRILRPAVWAGSAIAPSVFSKYLRPGKTDDPKIVEMLEQFPLFLLLEATKKK